MPGPGVLVAGQGSDTLVSARRPTPSAAPLQPGRRVAQEIASKLRLNVAMLLTLLQTLASLGVGQAGKTEQQKGEAERSSERREVLRQAPWLAT